MDQVSLNISSQTLKEGKRRKKQGACPSGRRPSIRDIRVEGCMSPVRGRFAIALARA